MNLYFQVGYRSWICVRNCYDWYDATNRIKYYWDISQLKCLNEEDFKKIKENVVLSF